jgi:membrane protein
MGTWSLLRDTVRAWKDDNVPRLSAALAYYTCLSLAPLLIIAIAVAGLAFGERAARGEIARQLGTVVGDQAARGIQAIVSSARSRSSGVIGTGVGLGALLLGASGVFGELQSAFDEIWNVGPKPGRGVVGVVRDRFFSFTMVLGVAFLLLVSLIISAALAAAGHYLSHALPGGEALWHGLNFAISFVVVTLLFAVIFVYVPDVELAFRDVWPGAALTALLFTIGKFALGLYLGKSSVSSSYGAAGSVVALVVWVYYAAQILFFGAEFVRVRTRHRGRSVEPSPNAVRIVHSRARVR